MYTDTLHRSYNEPAHEHHHHILEDERNEEKKIRLYVTSWILMLFYNDLVMETTLNFSYQHYVTVCIENTVIDCEKDFCKCLSVPILVMDFRM